MSKESQDLNSEILEFLALEKAAQEETLATVDLQKETSKGTPDYDNQKAEIGKQNPSTDLETDIAIAAQTLTTYRQQKKQQEQNLYMFKPLFKQEKPGLSTQDKSKEAPYDPRQQMELRQSRVRQLKKQKEGEGQGFNEMQQSCDKNQQNKEEFYICNSTNDFMLQQKQQLSNLQISDTEQGNKMYFKNKLVSPSRGSRTIHLGSGEFQIIPQTTSSMNTINILEKAKNLEEENLLMEQKFLQIREQVKKESKLHNLEFQASSGQNQIEKGSQK